MSYERLIKAWVLPFYVYLILWFMIGTNLTNGVKVDSMRFSILCYYCDYELKIKK